MPKKVAIIQKEEEAEEEDEGEGKEEEEDDEDFCIFPITDIDLNDEKKKKSEEELEEPTKEIISPLKEKWKGRQPMMTLKERRRSLLSGNRLPLNFSPRTRFDSGLFSPHSIIEVPKNRWQEAVLKLQKLQDPWKKYKLERNRAERCVRHRYNPLTRKWVKDQVIVRMEKEPFNRGAMRECFRLKKITTVRNSDKDLKLHEIVLKMASDLNEWSAQARNFVAKKYIEEVSRSVYFEDVKLQMDAKLWGQEFNRHHPPKQVDILQMCVLEFIERAGKDLYHLENFIDGKYKKYNSNSGFVEDSVRMTPQAFSHFTFERSSHLLIVVDIQGVGDLWTDPQIHTYDGIKYGDGNLGIRGMALFFHSHICNEICKSLKLTKFDNFKPEKDKNNNNNLNILKCCCGYQECCCFGCINFNDIQCNITTICNLDNDQGCAGDQLTSNEKSGNKVSKAINIKDNLKLNELEMTRVRGEEEPIKNGTPLMFPSFIEQAEKFLKNKQEEEDENEKKINFKKQNGDYEKEEKDKEEEEEEEDNLEEGKEENGKINVEINIHNPEGESSEEEEKEDERDEGFGSPSPSLNNKWIRKGKRTRFLSGSEGSAANTLTEEEERRNFQIALKKGARSSSVLEEIQKRSTSLFSDLSVLGQLHHEMAKYHEIGRFVAKGTPFDPRAALYHEQNAAKLGVLEANLTLGQICLNLPHDILSSITLKKEYKKVGLEFIKNAANYGDRKSMLFLSNSYRYGDPVLSDGKANYKESAHWLNRWLDKYNKDQSEAENETNSAYLEEEPAYQVMATLAELLKEGGNGLTADGQASGDWFSKAAEVAMEMMKGKLANKYYALAEEAYALVEE